MTTQRHQATAHTKNKPEAVLAFIYDTITIASAA